VIDRAESELDKVHRLVRIEEERLAWQEAIVVSMERDDQHEAAQLGRQLLKMMAAALDAAKRRLRAVERRSMH
jgi:hypothetical protein